VPAVLAVDIGGTKLAAALVDADGAILRAARRPTDTTDPWPGLAALLDKVRGDEEVLAVGCGCGGPMRWPDGEVSPLNIPGWRGFPLRTALAQHLGVPARVHNDAVCLAVGEHWRGAGQQADGLLGIVVSTGIGGGLVLDGRVVDGTSGNAGHIGHLVVDPDGPPCECGGRGCLEAVARGPALVAWARERGAPAADGRELAALAAEGHEVALAAFARAGRALGVAIAGAAALTDVSVVAVGGGLAQAGDPLWRPLQLALAEHVRLGFLSGLRVVPAALGQDAGLVGAAALVHAGDRYWNGEGRPPR
jgi:glucokinase